MSFMRTTKAKRATPALSHKNKVKKKPRKPQWDDTVNDLTVYKASPEEVQRRKAVHKSNNLEEVKEELQNKSIAAARRRQNSSRTSQQSALIKEVLYDQSQLLDVLSRSDRTMAVVKDLFGDAPPRYKGIPNITCVPDQTNQSLMNRSEGLIYQEPEISTQMDMLSQSHMDKSALNEMDEEQSEEESTDLQYQPQIDLDRFRHFLEKERADPQELSTIQGSQVTAAPLSVQQGQASSTFVQGKKAVPAPSGGPSLSLPTGDKAVYTPKTTGDSSGAINGTEKAKRSKSRMNKSPSPLNVSGLTNITALKQVLVSLENELADYEQKTGRQPAAERLYTDTFSGYTVAIVDAVTRLVRYLKQTEIQLAAEMTVREQLSQEVQHLNQLVDAVTSDIISTQEENVKIREEFAKYKQNTDEQFNYLKNMYSEMNKRPMNLSTPSTVNSGRRRSENRQDSPSVDELANQMTEVLSSGPHQKRPAPPVISTAATTARVDSYGYNSAMPGTGNLPTWSSDSTTAHVIVPRPAPLVTLDHTHGHQPQQQPLQTLQSTVRGPSPSLSQQNISMPEYASLPVSQPQQSTQQWRPLKEVTNTQHLQAAVTEESREKLFKSQILQIAQQVAVLNEQHSQAQDRLQQLQRGLSPTGQLQENGQTLDKATAQGQQSNLQTMKPNAGHGDKMEKENPSLQIQELNKQLKEAQQKMAVILQQQTRAAVSPPISPIPTESARNTLQTPTYSVQPQQTLQPGHKGITVALPRIEELEISATSTPSPKSVESRRSRMHGQVPIVSVYSGQGNHFS